MTFTSDPEGAAVYGAGGALLGLTPRSMEVPYGERAVVYVFRKRGYVAKTMSLTPNAPSPLFAMLQEEPPAGSPAVAAPVVAVPTVDLEPPPRPEPTPRRRTRPVPEKAPVPARTRVAQPEGDDSMEPTDPNDR